MLIIRHSKAYRKAYRKISQSGRFPKKELDSVIDDLASGKRLEASYRDHELSGELIGHRECHLGPDLLLVYRIENGNLVLVLAGLGSHSELFG